MSSLAKNLRPSVWYTVPLLASGVLLLFVPKMLVVMGVAAVMALALAPENLDSISRLTRFVSEKLSKSAQRPAVVTGESDQTAGRVSGT